MNRTKVVSHRTVRYHSRTFSTDPKPESVFTVLAKRLKIRMDVTPPTIVTPKPDAPKIDVKHYRFGKFGRIIDAKNWEEKDYQYAGGAVSSGIGIFVWRRAIRPYYLDVRGFIAREFSDGEKITVYVQATNEAGWQGQIIRVGVLFTTARTEGATGITLFRNDYFWLSKRIENHTTTNTEYALMSEKQIMASVTTEVGNKMDSKLNVMKWEMDEKFDGMNVVFDDKFKKMDEKLDGMNVVIDDKFEKMEVKLKDHMV